MDRELVKLGAKIELAKREFFYCQLKAPDFYKSDRKYLVHLCDAIQIFLDSDEEVLIINEPPKHELLQRPWLGSNYSKRLWKNTAKLAAALKSKLLVGLQQGKSVTEIAIGINKVMGQGLDVAHRLVRTETMHYLNDATLQKYKDCGIKWVQVWTAEDERVCEQCGPLHKKYFRVDQVPVLPLHLNCRCTIIPVTDEKKIAELEKKYDTKKWLDEKTMKLSIPDEVAKGSGMSTRIRREINSAIRNLEKEYNVYWDSIVGGKGEPGDIFSTGVYTENGIIKFAVVFNYNIDYEMVEKRMKRLYNTNKIAGKSFEDYLAHEMAYVLPFQNCVTESDYRRTKNDISKRYVPGISKYADDEKDGTESLAEAFVRYRNGEAVPKDAVKLIEKYIIPWRRT